MLINQKFWEVFLLEWVLDVSQIIIADIVLSGDNALIIGMAASAVPEESRKKVIFIGLMAAAVLRVLFALVASYLISIPGLLLLGGLLLFWVCWKFYGDIKEFSSYKDWTPRPLQSQLLVFNGFRLI